MHPAEESNKLCAIVRAFTLVTNKFLTTRRLLPARPQTLTSSWHSRWSASAHWMDGWLCLSVDVTKQWVWHRKLRTTVIRRHTAAEGLSHTHFWKLTQPAVQRKRLAAEGPERGSRGGWGSDACRQWWVSRLWPWWRVWETGRSRFKKYLIELIRT